jgi:pyridoxamine 5'-phosphate oxidase
MDEIDLARIRHSYEFTELREETVASNPIDQLRRWLVDAHAAGVREPNAMCLCTALGGHPSARIVLLRGLDEAGLVFFTSYFSRKGRELAQNPRAAAVLYWALLERQVRVEGDVDRLSDEDSDAYFASRPRGHQIGAWASEQSDVVESRDILEQRVRDYSERFQDEEIPRPHSWGGFLIKPVRLEFWQGRPNRMHDRIEFMRRAGEWTMQRLQP